MFTISSARQSIRPCHPPKWRATYWTRAVAQCISIGRIDRQVQNAVLPSQRKSNGHVQPRFFPMGRHYATNIGNTSSTDSIPPERWIQALESVANAEWLTRRPIDPADRLRRAYALLMQVILYLHRPQVEAEQYLVDFMQAEVLPNSEMHRARQATTCIIRVVLQDMVSVPSHPLHADNPQVFALLGALMPLHDLYLSGLNEKNGDYLSLPEWTTFWEKAQPILLELALKLDEAGFGLEKEE